MRAMPRIVWRIEDAHLTLVDRERLGVTLQLPGEAPIAIPPLTLGAWPFSFAGRQLELRTLRNLDRLRYQLWCEGHLLPRGEVVRLPSPAPTCKTHTSEPAVCACTRCEDPVCRRCSPNAIHCAPCLDALAENDRLAAVRARRLGIGVSIAIGAAFAGVGVAARSPALLQLGSVTIVLVGFLYARGLWREHRERRQGHASAVDRQRR
jgi:hypothetical protein